MSKKSFFKEDNSRDLRKRVNELDMESITKEKIISLSKNPNKEEIKEIVTVIENDTNLSKDNKDYLLDSIKKMYASVFNFDNCPDNYDELKAEAKFLVGISHSSFLLLAQRLMKIRDNDLYKADNYPDFKTFIEKELNIAQRTVYHYINICECFGLPTLAIEDDLEYTKLLPAIPILKSVNKDIPKDIIKKQFISDARSKSARELQKNANELKIKYGISNKIDDINEFEKIIKYFTSKIPVDLSEKDKSEIKSLIKYLSDRVG